MATIAEQLTSLANTKTAIKQAIIDKGVSVADTDPFSAYPAKIGEIQAGGGGTATKFGASLDTFFGDVVDGVLNKTAWTGALNFAGVTEIGSNALYYAFYNNTRITSVDLSSIITIGYCGMEYTFNGCTGITSVDLSSLQSVSYSGMNAAFSGCRGITSLDLSSLQSVGNSGMLSAFNGCTGITSVDLSSLESVGQFSLNGAFSGCTGLTAISFPSLTSVDTSSFNKVFRNCTALTEIHFRADMQATIEAMTGYADKFGATNATIIFDL